MSQIHVSRKHANRLIILVLLLLALDSLITTPGYSESGAGRVTVDRGRPSAPARESALSSGLTFEQAAPVTFFEPGGNLLGLTAAPQQFDPIIGGQIISNGQNITICVDQGAATALANLYLSKPPPRRFLSNNQVPRGCTVNVNVGTFPANTELVFETEIPSTGRSFFTGPTCRNPDCGYHNRVTFNRLGVPFVGFEDAFGGGDGDFDDSLFQITSANVTINPPNENSCTRIQFSSATYNVVEGNPSAVITVTRTGPADQAMAVNYATSDGTAQAPGDYTATAGTLSFGVGVTSRTFSVPIINDALSEGAETLNLTLSGLTPCTLGSPAVLTIADNDPLPGLSINDASVTEAGSGTLSVSLSTASGQPVTVDFASSDGTAGTPDDYAAVSGTITFAPGETLKTIALQVVNDGFNEPDETFFVNLSNAAGAIIMKGQGQVTIVGNGIPVLSIDDVAVAEGNAGTTDALFTVRLSAASSQTVMVNYATADDTAQQPGDYTGTSGTLSFAPGETSKTIQMPVIGDTTVEPNETFFVNLSGASNATIGDGQGVGTITDDDALPLVCLSSANKLTANDAEVQDSFGLSAAISGSTMVVGAPSEDAGGSNAGAAYVYGRNADGTWSLQQKLAANDATANDFFGSAVAIGGDTIVVGAPFDQNPGGAAYVYVRNGTTWSQQQKLTGSGPAPNIFGSSVAISDNTIVVGAEWEDNVDRSKTRVGAVYVYERSGTTWNLEQKLTAGASAEPSDRFGFSVSVSGSTIAVGVPFEQNAGGSGPGATYIYERSGTTWSLQQKLTPAAAAADDLFGYSVAIIGDTVMAGAPGDDDVATDEGAVYVYDRSGTTWGLQQKLTVDSDAATRGSLGGHVAIGGNAAVVGTYNLGLVTTIPCSGNGLDVGSGAVYVYERNGASWSLQRKLTVCDAAADDAFSTSVAISGNTAVIGAPLDDAAGCDAGATYVYEVQPTSPIPTCPGAVYSNNFEGAVGPEWSDTLTDVTPAGARRFLGQFTNQTVGLSLDSLPSHTSVTVSFDLFIIRSWDGNGPVGEEWQFSASGGPTFLTTFTNAVEFGKTQAYPDAHPASHPAHTGATEVDTLGYGVNGSGDSVYHLSFTFPHTTNSLALNFAGIGLQDVSDESWGLDNVCVRLESSPYTLTASPSAVSPGNQLSISWTAPNGSSSQDWIGLYRLNDPNNGFLWWRYTGGAPSGSFTLVAPSQLGQYEFRYFTANSYTRVATSNAVTVSTPAVTLTASPSAVSPGNQLSISWTAPNGSSSQDWIGLYRLNDPNNGFLWWRYTGGAPSGSFTLVAPSQLGQYEFRYFTANSYTRVATSNAVTVSTPAVTLTASPSAVSPGNQLSISWTAPNGSSSQDWIGLYRLNDPNNGFLWWRFTGGAPSGSFTLVAPSQLGQYEFRYFTANSYTRVATSNAVTVSTPAVTLTASPSAVSPGNQLSISWTAPNGSSSQDWIGLYRVNDPNTGFLWWRFTGGAPSGSFTLAAPSQVGQYEFRYLPNNGFTDVARSNTVTVTMTATQTPGPQ